ncbi:nuclear transport factor 2 family protein [Aggregicoccus sp. 17bor-14]|uniref:nuclear transport factor 2 family protein n=1 Tax=Myxococcaceae TaxID=31 RepID=UPI00129C2C31|nr:MULTISPECIES: nuclear transport factor 2 family protein [Myxococcaceae]MBF5043316.1 nuclear transport factor 2 family protein [Simulacricoccus sp. 17bor-14]MRI89075.1 nuclear transport factor 2 family protein [Aggregicoccus sp. 17bor-14]
MSQDETRRIAQEFLARLGSGAEPEAIAALFSPDVDFHIPGDVGALPWIGRASGRSAVVRFIAGMRELLAPKRFEVHDIFVSGNRAIILGELASSLKATGGSVDQHYAMVLTVSGGLVTDFLMLEDSFAVSRAAQVPGPPSAP